MSVCLYCYLAITVEDERLSIFIHHNQLNGEIVPRISQSNAFILPLAVHFGFDGTDAD